MRMMLKAKFETEAVSQAISDGSFPQILQDTLARLRPEATYFGPESGVRTAFIVFDMSDPSQLPAISEPLFKLKATVQIFPLMNLEDLQKGLQQLGQNG